MRYAELRRHVWLLWMEARYLHPIDPPYRSWIVERTVERTLEAQVACDTATEELGTHLIHDYTPHLPGPEHDRFTFWWQHVMNHGFHGDNPLAHLHKPKAKAKA